MEIMENKRGNKPFSLKGFGAVVLFLVLGAVYIYATPYIAAYDLQNAVKNGDKQTLAEVMDFPVLRKNIKNQLNIELATEMTKDSKDNPFRILGVAFVTKFIDAVVDDLVTPEGLAALVKHGKSSLEKDSASDTQEPQTESAEHNARDFRLMYKSLNRFNIVVERNSATLTLVLTRDSFLGMWKLTDIEGVQTFSKKDVANSEHASASESKEPSMSAESEKDALDNSEKNLWVMDSDSDPIDDSKNVYMGLTSISGKDKWGKRINFLVRCKNNQTDVIISWGYRLTGFDLNSNANYDVTERIGKQKAVTTSWSLSTDEDSTFHRSPIPFLKKMMTANKLAAKVEPYRNPSITAVWDTSGMKEAIKPLREACNW